MQSRIQQREHKFLMIEDWQNSGLSQKQYCLQHEVAYPQFQYWYKRYRMHQSKDASVAAGFITVALQDTRMGGVELHLPDGKKLLFHQPVKVTYLKALIG